MQPSSRIIGVTAAVGAAALLGTGLAAAAPVEWKDCVDVVGTDAPALPGGRVVECGTVRVPVDYAHPDGAQTTVGLTRIKASSGHAKSTVFGNPGGPGNSALGYWLPKDATTTPELYRDHDLVAVQPRGLYGSNPMQCDPAKIGPVSVNHLADACYGTDAAYMRSLTTENVARDHDAVRDALGVATVDWVGQSYGTAVAADYATLFPEHTGRVVLDSNVNPDWRWRTQAEQTTLAQQSRVYDVFQWIADRDDYYHLGDTPLKVFHSWKWVTDQEVGGSPNLTPPAAVERDLPVELRGTPLQQPVLDVVNSTAPGRARAEGLGRALLLQDYTNTATTGLFDATVGATHTEQAWPMLAHVLRYYNDGGQIPHVGIVQAQKIRQVRENRPAALQTDAAMFDIVTCNESAPADPIGIAAAKVDSALGGNALVDKAAAQAAGDGCLGWAPPSPNVQPSGAGLATPPLILNSEHDALTPMAGAERMQQLMGGDLVTVGGGDHGVFRSGNQGVDDLVTGYLGGEPVDVSALPGQPSPQPLPKWDAADRAAAAGRGMAAQVDDWYGVQQDNGATAARQVQTGVEQGVAALRTGLGQMQQSAPVG